MNGNAESYIRSLEQVQASPIPPEKIIAVGGPVGQNTLFTNSLSATSFLRKEKAERPPWYPVAAFAWLLLRDVCDWYDADFTQAGEEPHSPKQSISIRLLLLFVPPLALLDLVLNFLFCVSIFPVLFLWCCYPFKPKVLSSRKEGPPYSCCPFHEGCDPWMRVWTSLFLVIATPFILSGVCLPQLVVSKMVQWADGHTAIEERLLSIEDFEYRQYRDERDLGTVMKLVDNELSEPYHIFTYRFFLHNWPKLCFLSFDGEHCFGTVVCKLESRGETLQRGYIAMLVVEEKYRKHGVGRHLVKLAIEEMIAQGAQEISLEAEVTNTGALRLYESLGFLRDKRLHRYYLNGTGAFRLKLLLPMKNTNGENGDTVCNSND